MNKKRKTLFVALLSVFTTAGLLAACKPGKDITEIPADKDYGFTNPSVQHMPPDAGYNIDGVLDEEGYKNSTWIHLHNDNGTSVVDMAMTSRYGEKGMYFAYDVTENTPIYVNPERASYINSGIEMYLAPNGVTSMSSENIFEIDLEADGTLTFKRNNGQPGQWANVATTSDIMAYLAAQPKGGEVNTEECYGYTLEFFIPWDYLSWLGLNVDTIKEEAVYVNPVHITSYNYEGNDHNRDRYWYSFATQLGGDGWGNVNQYFKFGANGAVGTVPITIGEGVHCTLSGPDAVMPGLPATITVTPESGYSVTSFKCNNAESVKLLNYNEDGSATYTVYGAEGGITFSAEAEEVTAGKKTLSGKINLKKAGGDTYDNLVASYTDADGLHDLAVDANGRFTLADLAQGYYTIEVEKEGYGSVKRGIYLNRDTEIQIDFEFATFDKVDGTCWDILNANDGYVIKRSGRGAILSKNSYGTFYAEANFRYDEALAAKSNADEYYQQRMGFRIKFSEGKYWHPDVMCEAGSFKVTYGKILNSESIFNWDTVHTMNAKQIAKYKSAEGIKLGILRVGTTAYIYLDGELVSTTDLGAQGIKADETAQIGFEGYVYNTENVRVNYVFKDKNANEVVLNDVNSVGGSVQFDDSYKIGNDLLLVLDKENASEVLLSLLVDGEEMSGEVVTEEDGTQMLTIRANKKLVLNVTAVYGSAGEVTANIAVESAWKANGIKFTFTDAEDDSLVYTATVANNKMTVENMKKGLYEVTAEVFGAKVDLGAYSVVSGEEKLLEVEKVFINGKALDSAVIDLSNGEFIYHSAIDENYSIKLNAEKGDAYLASRISLTAQDKATLLKGGEVSFGMYMTVEDEDGKAHTHWVDFWFKNAGDDNWLSLRTDFGWAEDICKPLTTAIDVNKYSKALFGDGLYVVLRYNSEKGVMETYFGDKDYNVAYLRDWNDANNLFPKNGKVTALGFRDNLTWGGTPVSATVQGFRYGRTLMEALGVEGKTIEITGVGEKANGEISVPATQCGGDVTITLIPDNGYKVASLTVNGEAVDISEITGGRTYIIKNYMGAKLTVDATFEQTVNSSVDAVVSGVKLGETQSLAGKTVTLSGNGLANVTEKIDGNGHLVIQSIPTGTWNLEVEGYLPTTITIAENAAYDTAIVLECDTFKELLHWGKFDFTKQNDETPEIKITNDSAAIITNDTYGSDVMASIYLDGNNFAAGSSMGLMFRFVGDNMNDLVVLNMQGTKKVHFAESSLWAEYGAPTKDTKMAAGAGWKNLLYFIDCDDDGASRTADAHSEEYMADFAKGTLKLSALRKGNVIYAFLNDRYIGQQVLNEKYANAKCEAGFIAACGNNGEWKSWKFDITDDADNFPALTVKVTDETANEAHGTVSGIPAEAVALGDEVTVTVNPENGYKLKALTVNGVDVTAKISGKEYTFTVNGETTVIATFEEITVGSIAAEITGKKMGVTGNALAAGTKVTLTAAGLDAVETQTVEKDGKIVISIEEIPAATWTVNVDRYFTTELTVEKNAEFNTAIALEYDLLENLTTKWGWGDKADLSRQNDGIIQQAGGVTQWVSSKDTYNNVAVTASLLSGGHRQGVFVRFGNEYLMVQKEKDEKISWNGESDLWKQGTNLISATWTEYIKPLDMNNTQYTVTLVREANKIFVFVNGNYYDTKTLAEKYADAKCYVGVYCTDCPSGERTFEITEDISKYRKNVALTTEAEEEQGTIVVDNADGLKAGDTVTITVEAKEGFIIGTVTVGDVDVTAKLSNGEYTFNIAGDTTVVATFEEKQVGSINAEVIGKKFGVTGNLLTDGVKVTLTSAIAGTKEATLTDVEGKIMLKVDELVVGNWTVKVDEYIEAEITVEKDTEYAEAITLEYDGAFVKRLNWGSFDWSHINDGDNAYFVASNGCQMVMTKDTYGDTAFTMYLGGENRQGGNQGLFFLFGTEAVYVRLENNATKLHFSNDFEWMTNHDDKIGEAFSMADGHGWQNLIHLKNNNEGTADADAQTLLGKYEAGTLKLTVVRRGATFYAFLDDRYVGQRTFNSKYADMKASVGVTWSGLSDGVNKTFKVDMPEIWTYHITNATAENANGSVVVSDSDPRIGDKVTLTINPVDGYIVKSLTVGGKDVTGSVTFDKTTLIGTYEFNITGAVTVAAEFEEATYGSIESAVSANKYGETGPVEMNGTVVKLSGAMTEYEIKVADGKIVQGNVLAGVYTVVKEGYIPHTVTITADGTYSEAITFVYQLFTSVPASADLSEISSGKVTATGKGGIDLVTKESYNDFTAEAVFDVPDYNSRRYSISLVFDDGKNFRVDLAVQDNGNNILQETDWSSMMSFKWDWVDFPEDYFADGTNSYTEQEIRDEFIAKGLTYKLERTGSVIKLYINGVLMKTYELKSEYANKSAQLRFVQDSNGTDGTKGFTFDISVPEVTD